MERQKIQIEQYNIERTSWRIITITSRLIININLLKSRKCHTGKRIEKCINGKNKKSPETDPYTYCQPDL